MTMRMVCGWFTPDYEHWVPRLRASLDAVGEVHHIVPLRSLGPWSYNTMTKPAVVRSFRQAFPDRTLILLDVDCVVRGSLEPLELGVHGDVAAHVLARTSGRGKDRARVKIMSGTMVFRPTSGADRFIDAWQRAAIYECGPGDVDQTALMIAMARETRFTFQPLGAEWCAWAGNDHPNPVIYHDNASRDVRRSRWPMTMLTRIGGFR